MGTARAYLLALAAIYVGFAVWCTLWPQTTASSLGYTLQGPSGLCEYRVVYGGLELGLGLFFVLGAFRRSMELAALWLALLMHGCLVLYRAAIVLSTPGLSGVIVTIFGLELLLAVTAAWITVPRGLPRETGTR